MTALEKLRTAIDSVRGFNGDPHDVAISTFDPDGDGVTLLMIAPERESWQDDDGEEPEALTLFDLRAALDEITELMKRPPVDFVPLPADPNEAYLAMLAQWENAKANLAYHKEQEGELRRILFAGAFPNPVEGTNKHKLPDGRVIKGQYKISRKIDEAALPVTLAAMRERGVANTDALVVYKPSLAKREWNTLSPENKMVFAAAVIATPGMPALDVELPKKGR